MTNVNQAVDERIERKLSQYENSPSTEVDVVRDLDHTGDVSKEIQSYLELTNPEAPVFRFDGGTYSWNTEFDMREVDADTKFISFYSPSKATFEITNDDVGTAFRVGSGHAPFGGLQIKNIDVDISDKSNRDAGLFTAFCDSIIELENVRLIGQRNRAGPNQGSKYTCFYNLIRPEATGRLKNVHVLDGDRETGGQFDGAIGFCADPYHEGTMYLEGCAIVGHPDNGYYVANSPGSSHLRSCYAANNGGGNIRLGRNDTARDCKIYLDNADDVDRPGCGLWLCNYADENDNQRIRAPVAENIIIDAPNAGNHLIRANSETKGAVYRDIEVYVGEETKSLALRATGPRSQLPIRFENITILDNSDSDYSAYCRKPGVEYENLTVISETRNAVFCDAPSFFERCKFEGKNTAFAYESDGITIRDSHLSNGNFTIRKQEDIDVGGSRLDNINFIYSDSVDKNKVAIRGFL